MTAETTTATGQGSSAHRDWTLFAGIGVGALSGVLVGFALTLFVSAPPGVNEPGLAVVVGLPLARAALDLAALTTVGMSLLPKLLGFDRPQVVEPTLAVARGVAVVSSAIWALAALTSLALQTADLYPGQPVTMGEITGYVREFGAGQGLVIVAGCALLYLGIAVLAVRRGETVPAELRITVAMFTVLPLPVTGHAANTGPNLHDISMIAMELHVLGALVWTGGLLAVMMLVGGNRGLLAEALPRYSKIATLCVFGTALTGMFTGWLELYLTPGVHWYLALFTTGYGQILLAKGGCVAAAGLLGAHIRFRLLPAIVRHTRTAVLRWAGAELMVMAVAVGLAAVLVRAPVVGGS